MSDMPPAPVAPRCSCGALLEPGATRCWLCRQVVEGQPVYSAAAPLDSLPTDDLQRKSGCGLTALLGVLTLVFLGSIFAVPGLGILVFIGMVIVGGMLRTRRTHKEETGLADIG